MLAAALQHKQERLHTIQQLYFTAVHIDTQTLFVSLSLLDARVRIQLSNNDTITRELRIREGVVVTLDCTARLNETIARIAEAGLPLSVLRGITWYAQFIDVRGELIGSEIVVTVPRIGAGTIM